MGCHRPIGVCARSAALRPRAVRVLLAPLVASPLPAEQE